MSQKPSIYFISGVCGAGKTTVLKELKKILPSESFDIRDFDERGVPDGGGREWHNKETLHWLTVAQENAEQGKSTIIGGFTEPDRFRNIYRPDEHPSARLFLLHASGDVIRERLIGRYPTPESIKEINRAAGVPLEQFIANNVSYAPELREIFEKDGATIIDTDDKSAAEVASAIAREL